MSDKTMEFIISRDLRGDNSLRAAVELALRVPPGGQLPPTAAVLDAVTPWVAERVGRACDSTRNVERESWSALVDECRRQVDVLVRWQERQAGGSGVLVEAASLVAGFSCERLTTGPGSCTRAGNGWYAYSQYGIDRWCLPCVVWAALNGVPLTRHPAGWCDACDATIEGVDDGSAGGAS